MNSFYYELKIETETELQEILIAELSDINFEGFYQDNEILTAYSTSDMVLKNELEEILAKYGVKSYQLEKLKNQNWNEEWEKNFDSISIGNELYIRAQFHPEKTTCKNTILIQPKMSFGTGHHSTTKLVLTEMIDLNFNDKKVLDMGCGTAVLAIYAEMKGAKEILAIDNDEWAYNNSVENCEINNCKNIVVKLGDEKLLTENTKFDIVISNITKNFNLANLPLYSKVVAKGGKILLSGFYAADATDFITLANKLQLNLINQQTEKNWTILHFEKF
jgi:ribosomal protein L11 methyltransferase